ncbi:TetR/AcrR family transcriptional regulator [Microbacterium sp.]|uniref:TetR/AcrR family transcriptional regulator n=1 Tax=Microbacterium sp. TaxID=51671 RepID=UPI0039E3C387
MANHPSRLRERQRLELRRDIHAALLELSAEVGYAQVTVDQISTHVGISPRTFFNYFPTKDSAAVSDPLGTLDEDETARFLEQTSNDPHTVLVELTETLVEHLDRHEPDCADVHAVLALAQQNPTVFQALVAQLDHRRMEITEIVRRRLDPTVDPQLAELIGALAMAAVRSGVQAWSEGGRARRVRNPGSPVPHVRHALDLMGTLIPRAWQAPTASSTPSTTKKELP